MSTREAALEGLFTALKTIAGVTWERNDPTPEDIPEGGYGSLEDGDPGDPEVGLSPVSYAYSHAADLLIAVQHSDSATRDATFAAILVAIDAALIADPALGGTVDYVESQAAEPNHDYQEGLAPTKFARIPIILEYVTAQPNT